MVLDSTIGSLREAATNRFWSEREVRRQVGLRIERYRSLGLTRGDRVLVHFGNEIELFTEILAVWHLGGCVIPIDARLTPFEVETLARAAEAKFSIVNDSTDAARRGALGEAVVVHTADHGRGDPADESSGSLRLDDDALILFTSGTTGKPKGVVHTHRSLRARWTTLQQSLGVLPYRRTLCVLPTHFGHGLICNCLFPWLLGCDLVIAPPFKPTMLMQLGSVIDEYQITFMSSVPSMWKLVLRTAKRPTTSTLQRIHIGSAPLSADVWGQVQEWVGINEVINAYGITETGSWVAGSTGGEIVPEDGLIGVPWGARIAVLRARSVEELSHGSVRCETDEPGMIWVNTPALMRGYFQRSDLTEAVVHQGWFLTGDIGAIDGRGRLVLRGRQRDEINKGGTKVYPEDVDAVVQRFDGVADACTFGVEDHLYGENVAIAVVLRDREPETIVRLHRWIIKHLAEQKRPERWYILDAIPRTDRGKLNREEIGRACSTRAPLNLKDILRDYRHRGENQ